MGILLTIIISSFLPFLIIPFIIPLLMLFVGKKLVVVSENLRYWRLFLITFVGSLLSGLFSEFNSYLAIAVFFAIVALMIKKQLNTEWKEALIMAGSGVALAFIIAYVWLRILLGQLGLEGGIGEINVDSLKEFDAVGEIKVENREEPSEEPAEERKKPKLPALPLIEDAAEDTETKESLEPPVVLPAKEPVTSTPYDCGDNEECFEEKFLTCTPALYGMSEYGVVVDWKIIKEGNTCVLDMMMDQGFGKQISKCEFPIVDIKAKGLTMDSINDKAIVKQYCSGAIFNKYAAYFAEQEGAFICEDAECIDKKFAYCENAVFFDSRMTKEDVLKESKTQIKPEGNECFYSQEDLTNNIIVFSCRFPLDMVLSKAKPFSEFAEEIGEDVAMGYCEIAK